MVRKERPYANKKGKAFLYQGWLPMRIGVDGALDTYYVHSLRDLPKMEGKFVVELAKVKEEPSENFENEELREAEIKTREEAIEAIRRLIRKRRMLGL